MGGIGANHRTHVRSMTGFAKASQVVGAVSLDVELRGVNSRYLDLHFRGLRLDGAQERRVREIIREKHFRGKIEVVINLSQHVSKETLDEDNLKRIDALIEVFTSLCKRYGAGDDGLSHFLSSLLLTGAAGSKTDPSIEGKTEEVLFELIEVASSGLHESRCLEGSGLYHDVFPRLEKLTKISQTIRTSNDSMPEEVRARLRRRLEALCSDINFDSVRLEQEALILADKSDVSEELARLKIHVERCMIILQTEEYGPIGRQLDFVVQEIGRELNTIGSKAQDASMQGCVIDAKSELEKIREQVQNIE